MNDSHAAFSIVYRFRKANVSAIEPSGLVIDRIIEYRHTRTHTYIYDVKYMLTMTLFFRKINSHPYLDMIQTQI